MSALTAPRDTIELANGAKKLFFPVKAATTIYQGALVAIDADGYAIPAAAASNLAVVGRAEETVVNAGADGTESITVARGVFIFDNSPTNAVTAAYTYRPCYVEDDHTVRANDVGSSMVGRVLRIDSDGVVVEVGTGSLAAYTGESSGQGEVAEPPAENDP